MAEKPQKMWSSGPEALMYESLDPLDLSLAVGSWRVPGPRYTLYLATLTRLDVGSCSLPGLQARSL